MDRDPNLQPDAYLGVFSDIQSDVHSDEEGYDLREALSFWADPQNVDQPTEEQRLSEFLEALGRDERSGLGPNDIPNNPVGRRRAPRLRVSLPARFVAVDRTHPCILLNISQTGAQIAILNSVREGEAGMLECGGVEAFAMVVRSEFSLNALHFDEQLSYEQVIDIRRLYETFEVRERRQLIETARQWASGESKDGRAM
ncbi:MAG: PilZ domain-containing protein [Pseudomonadota bacterium]